MTDDTDTVIAPADIQLAPKAAAVTPEGGSDEIVKLSEDIIAAIKTVYDPEIPADVYELGLIYRIDIADDRKITVDMTLTTPNCPAAQDLPKMVEDAAASVPGVGPVTVNVVWDPPWDQSRMSEEARVTLNIW